MWFRGCAPPRRPPHPWPRSKDALADSFRNAALFVFAVSLFLTLPFAARADEPIIAAITLNQQQKGDFFVILLEDGDFLVRTEDLLAMGLTRIPGRKVVRGGETFLSLESADHLTYRFDETSLTIEITAEPELLGRTTLDLSPAERIGIYYPSDDSIFLNYGADYRTVGENLDFESFTLTNELGVRVNDVLLLTDTILTHTSERTEFVRLNSSIIYDHRPTLRRFVAGDLVASNGTLGSNVNLGGLSFRKIYDIDPYFIDYPMFDFRGQLPLPSEVEIYLGGTRLRSERLPPGEFALENLYGINGEQTIEVVIRDAFGRVRRILHPFYFTDKLLRRGLHEYSYNVGWVRTDFGRSSSSYEDLAASAFHRYGFSETLNLGWRGEANRELANLGMESAFKIGHIGLMRLEGSASRHEGSTGAAGLLSYEYLSPRFRAQLALQRFSSAYRTLADNLPDRSQGRRSSLRAGLGYSSPRTGSLGIEYLRSRFFDQEPREVVTLSWSRKIWKRSYLNATVRQVREGTTDHEILLNLTHYFGHEYSVAGNIRQDRQSNVQSVEVRKSIPVGEGTGWELHAERSETDLGEEALIDADFQQNARRAVLRGDYRHVFGDEETEDAFRMAISGAVVRLGGTTALTRPVNDSFGLVRVGSAEAVEVQVNGQSVGRTDDQGKVIVPELNSYYENQVSFDAEDVPIDLLMPRIRMTVSPPLRSGSCLNFPLQKYQAFVGRIVLGEGPGASPLADAELTLKMPGGGIAFWTGSGGEFYLDGQEAGFDLLAAQGCDVIPTAGSPIPPGTYPLTVRREQGSFETELTLPLSTATYVEMGEIALPKPPAPSGGSEPPSGEEARSDAKTPSERPPEADVRRAEPAPDASESDVHEPPESPRRYVVHFPFDSSLPLAVDQPVLGAAVEELRREPGLAVEIEGHASREGPPSYNLQLASQRILAVKAYLIEAGIAPDRITRTLSLGEQQPLCTESDLECRRRNRRAVLTVVKPPSNW